MSQKIISQVVSNIRSFSSGFYSGKKPTAKISTGNELTEPLLKKTENTPAPEPFDPNLIAQALDPLKRVLPLKSYTALSGTCQTLFKSSKGDANEIAISKLASHVLWNRPRAVTQILEAAKNDPEKLERLLTNSVTISVTLPSGLLFKGLTPFQAALCTWNTALCEKFKKYFDQIPNGLAIMQAQINQIFPEGVEKHIKKQKAAAKAFKDKTLKPLIETLSATDQKNVLAMIINKQSDTELGKAITRFREEIKKLSEEDLVHNPFYLQVAFHSYVEKLTLCGYNTQNLYYEGQEKKRMHAVLHCVQVIGSIQCYSPAYDLQAFAQGLQGLVEDWKAHQGSFKFKNIGYYSKRHYGDTQGVITDLRICNDHPLRGLGFDYLACQPDGGGSGRPWPPDMSKSSYFFSYFITRKFQAFTTFVNEVLRTPHSAQHQNRM